VKRFISLFCAFFLGQFLLLYLLEILGIKFVRYVFYDPIFSLIARSVDMGLNVIPIFLMFVFVFSVYAVILSSLLMALIDWKRALK
jgi:hypothetical protein